MNKIWEIFCGIIAILGVLYLMFYPIFFAIGHNAAECILSQDIITCVQIKIK